MSIMQFLSAVMRIIDPKDPVQVMEGDTLEIWWKRWVNQNSDPCSRLMGPCWETDYVLHYQPGPKTSIRTNGVWILINGRKVASLENWLHEYKIQHRKLVERFLGKENK